MNTGVKVFLIIVAGLAVLSALIAILKSKHITKSFALTAIQGVAAIFAVNIFGLVSGVTIAVNWYTLGVGTLFGTPGVISLLIIDAILK